jgi:cell division protease FtsH
MNGAKKLICILSLLCLVPQHTSATEPADTLKLAAQICLFSACSVASSLLAYKLYNYIGTQYYQYLAQKQEKERVLAGLANGTIKKITFQDVAGATVAKEELQDLVAYINNPDQYTSLGATIPKGILLYGPPGTGKTLLAKATAAEAGCAFLPMNGTDFVKMYVGLGAHTMAQLFEIARQKAPCIIFIDEIETIGKSRESYVVSDGSSEYANTLNQLLVEMDGFSSPSKPIIVIAATNRVDVLDKALLRPGRFDKLIYVPLPSLSERLDILTVHAQDIELADSVNLASIARGTSGFSGAALAELLKNAARIATKAKKSAVDEDDLEEARDIIIVGAENRNLGLTDQDKKETAYHEAGHALVRLLLDNHGTPLHKVTILPRGSTLGITWVLPERDRHSHSKDELETDIAICLAGRIAEEIALHQAFTGAGSDFETATNRARLMVCIEGMSPEMGPLFYGHEKPPYSQKTADTIDQVIRTIIDTAYTRTRELLTNNIDKLHLLAQELIEKETLSAEEIYTLLGLEPRIESTMLDSTVNDSD